MSSDLIRQDLVPMVVGYLLLMGSLAIGLRLLARPRSDARSAAGRRWQALRASLRPRRGWPRLILHLATTAAGGYVLLMAIDVLYYYGVARVPNSFLDSAFSGGALLMGITLPVFVALTWLTERRRRRASPSASPSPSDERGPATD
jgi:hypothetical protein